MNKHELNHTFEWENHRGPFRLLDEEQARQYDEQGFLVFEDVFDRETIEALIEELDPIERDLEKMIEEHFGGKIFITRSGEITFTPHTVLRSPKAREITRSPFFCDLVHDLLGDDVRLYWDQAVYKKPGTADIFPWHQDNGYSYVEPQQYLTCWLALTDADEENGCPIVLPGFHREGTWAHETTDLGFDCGANPTEHEAIAAPVRAGSLVAFSSLTPHKTGPNMTMDRIRKTYIIQFAPDGAEVLKQEGTEITRIPCDAADRQYPILVGGQPASDRGTA
ncbi:MAG: phytanoyl-CoA dioxygenase family protein [Myxococcales bacterium]|nr:phytanoyl-CoA dioxygenase family protein [Myxococcales bacterium]HIK83933.1 phytanoyl-CoA dioxygenase family protein [Myxococcales bacterium]